MCLRGLDSTTLRGGLLLQMCLLPRFDVRCGSPSDGHGADEDAILQHHAEHEEHEVQDEHGEAQLSAHPPAADGDGDDDEEEHEEEQHDGAEQAVGLDGHRLAVVQQSVYEPRDGQAATTGGGGQTIEVLVL